MSDVLTRLRREVDIPTLIGILARQQGETEYPIHWPPDRTPERFLRRPSEREVWVAELGGHIGGHVAIQSVADDELGQMWSAEHGVPIAWHEVTSEAGAKLLTIFTPGGFDHYFAELARLSETELDDDATMTALGERYDSWSR